MAVLYDSLGYNQEMLLDLPLREGIGTITQDVAKPHHVVYLINTPTWTALDTGLMTLDLDGAAEYLECEGATCADLDFTSGDYSIGGWFNQTASDHDAQIIIGRYEVSESGWELYLYTPTGSLNLRHHHAGTLVDGNPRTSASSLGWTTGTNWHFGVSRFGASAQFYRNGVAVTTVSGVFVDPETSAQDLVIGIRGTSKDDNYFDGMIGRLIVSGRVLTATEWLAMYEHQKRWFA